MTLAHVYIRELNNGYIEDIGKVRQEKIKNDNKNMIKVW